MVSSIAQDCAEYGNSMSLEEFREHFGYEDADADVSQNSYDGFRQTVDDLKRMFPDGEYEKFVELAQQK